MSLILMAQAMKMKVGNPLRKLVLIKLADNANDEGECWPSHKHIADHCEISDRSVRTHIKALEEANFLTIINRVKDNKKQSNIYKLHFEKAVFSTEGDSALTKISTAGDSVPTEGDSALSTEGDSYRTSHSFEPVNEPNNSNNAHEEIPCPLTKAKQTDQQSFRQLQTSDTHLAMTETWMPSETTIERIASLAIPVEFIKNQITNFRVYWITENRAPKSNTWDAAFLGNVQRNWTRHQNQQGANTHAANHQQRSTSGRYQQPGQFSIDHDDLSWFYEMQSEQSPFDAPASDGAGCESGELRPLTDHNDFPEVARALPNATGSEFGQKGLDANFGGAGRDE
jgi:hypothetical protein